jgi:N-ethylmaleimide reductase
MDAAHGNRLIAEGLADLVAFGRPFIAHPHLVQRLKAGAPLAEIGCTTVYGSAPKGYSDYPALQLESA